MLDALQGRDKHGLLNAISKPRSVRFAFYYQTSDIEAGVFLIAVMLYAICAYFEDNYYSVGIGLAVPCLCIFIADVAAKAYYMTPSDCFNKAWNVVQVLARSASWPVCPSSGLCRT